MELKEINELISIRNYIVNALNNPTVERKVISEINSILLLVDKKILGLLTGPSFKDYVGYADVRKAIEDAARVTNIKSGLKKE